MRSCCLPSFSCELSGADRVRRAEPMSKRRLISTFNEEEGRCAPFPCPMARIFFSWRKPAPIFVQVVRDIGPSASRGTKPKGYVICSFAGLRCLQCARHELVFVEAVRDVMSGARQKPSPSFPSAVRGKQENENRQTRLRRGRILVAVRLLADGICAMEVGKPASDRQSPGRTD